MRNLLAPGDDTLISSGLTFPHAKPLTNSKERRRFFVRTLGTVFFTNGRR